MRLARPTPAVRPPLRLSEIASELPLCHASVRAAFEAQQFEVAYQPILCAQSLQPLAVEALLRWTHPTRGVQSPLDFLPILQRSQLAIDVGDWLLALAAAQVLAWDRLGLAPLRLAVNAAATQVLAADFAARVERILAQTGLPPNRLTLEISQDCLHGRSQVGTALARLVQLGVGIELDDFSGGPSTLLRLADLGIGGFKLDRRFIAGLADNRGGARDDVRLHAGIARERGLRCVAEGVQTEAELEQLRELGVTELQGFLFCPAVAPPALERFLRAPQAPRAHALPIAGNHGRA